ncbi:hypothetical protein FO440_23510 [Mucilaginibacter corticis]|uniref:DNA/RNA non-specific endonuclease n=1 Tax=Mucilaginibacter corticis TaxID=2597670 RepID=A0A556M7J4_9SPHI|nr:DNA/RNA non-specific endonuclease [Mucilaginibacter corticis]TSJ35891.1 hypothetical protein FO440_23510 [Mucilaginibacter corticis]
MKLFLYLIILCSSVVYAQDTVTIHHKRYTTTFDRVLLYPVKVYWVDSAENICTAKAPGHVKRTNDFKADPLLAGVTELREDYKQGSDRYDRGHNMDAADNACDVDQMHECFYYSNMTPQTKHLNEQTWKALEEYTRKLALSARRVEVWCGSYGSTEKIGRVTAPAFCWKILRYQGKVEAYLMPNTADVNLHPYYYYKSTVAEIRAGSKLALGEIKR